TAIPTRVVNDNEHGLAVAHWQGVQCRMPASYVDAAMNGRSTRGGFSRHEVRSCATTPPHLEQRCGGRAGSPHLRGTSSLVVVAVKPCRPERYRVSGVVPPGASRRARRVRHVDPRYVGWGGAVRMSEVSDA